MLSPTELLGKYIFLVGETNRCCAYRELHDDRQKKAISFAIYIAEKRFRMRSENSCRSYDINDCW